MLFDMSLNAYRLAGDCIHLMSFFGLILNILRTKSCASLSARTQLLLALTFILRYSDLFTVYISLYNTLFKVAFILSTLALIYLICFKYKSTNDLIHDQLRVELVILPIAFITFCMWWTSFEIVDTTEDILWAFSIYLEAFAILPQLYLVLKKGEADTSVAVYVGSLFVYRQLYILNWYYRYINENHLDIISVSGGLLQVIIYAQFMCLPIKYRSQINTKQEEAKLYFITPPTVYQEKVGLHETDGSKEFSTNLLP